MGAITSALIGAAGAIGGGLLAASGAKKAAKAQEKSAAADLAFQKEQAAKAEARLNPFVQAGYGGLSAYQDTLGLNGAAGDAVVLMYPGNQLKKQVREYGDTKSTPFKVLEKAFFGK